jgi:predicted O-linked N-acetylglucosamine transferase (SPINDLY family)
MGLVDRIRGALALGGQCAEAAEVERALKAYERDRIDDAAAMCQRIVDRDPRNARALHVLGLISERRGDPRQAARLIETAIVADPSNGLYHLNLGNALRALGRSDDALESYACATRLSPGRFAAWFNLAQLHVDRGERGAAVAAFRQALALESTNRAARIGLAAALVDAAQGAADGAAASAEAVSLLEVDWAHSPEPARARFLLAIALAGCSRWTEALPHLEALAAARPDAVPVRNELANCYNQLGRAADAVREYREIYWLAPEFHHALTSVLGTLNAVPGIAPEAVSEAHREWAAAAAAPLYPAAPNFANSRVSGRRLRVGYVSPDLRRHPVGAMFAPILERHDPGRVETFCYYNYPRGDVMTERIRASAHHWREVAALDDAAVADWIRADAIDILVDLVGHTKRTRLPVFARRPAPVQVSWLGYFNTTGLATMDYFVTDPVSSPPGQERYFVETLVRLPATRFCYEPPEYMPEVNAQPARRRGHVTFGCLNNLAKLNDRVLALWARILAAVPGSRLLLQASALSDLLVQRDFRARAAALGIPADRLELRRFVPVEQAPHTYHDIDIALDPFPFCGGMTSLDALWMGVPVVTLPQVMVAGRQSASMLANLGLPELIAADESAYESAAAGLARDLDRLEALRTGLRARFRASPLTDYERFTGDLEAAFREMWCQWLAP